MENYENGLDTRDDLLIDNGFDMGDDVELDPDNFYDDGIEFENDAELEMGESVIGGTLKLSAASNAVSVRSYLENALTADKSIKLSAEELELVTLTEFQNHTLISQSQKVKDELLDDAQALEETIKYYKVYNSDLLKERLKCINSHIKSVKQACDTAKMTYSKVLQESYTNAQTIQATISSISTGGKATDQSLYKLQERLKIVEIDRVEKLRDYRLMLYKNDMVLNFLNGYKTVYEKISIGELQSASRVYGLLRDLSFGEDGKHTARCSCCNHTVELTDEDLPSLNIGKAFYSINIGEDLQKLYESAKAQSAVNDSLFTEEAYNLLKQSALSLGYNNEVAYAEQMKYLSDRVQYLHKQPVLEHMQKNNPVGYTRYYSQLFNQVKADARVTFESYLSSQLVINPAPIKDAAVTQLFKNIKVPTLLNLLRNRHPLLMKKLTDDINKNSLTGKVPSVAFEYNRASAVTEFIMENLEDNFQYPNMEMKYIAKDIEEEEELDAFGQKKPKTANNSTNLLGNIRLDRMSPLRLNLPEIVCPECGAHLLYYHPIVTAMRTYLINFMSKGNILDEMDSSTTVNLKPLLSPVTKSRLKSSNDIFAKLENSKKAYNPIKKLASKERTINMDAGGNTIDTAGVTRSDIIETQGIIARIRAEKGLVSDNLATQYYRAYQAGNTLEMDKVLNENHRILTERKDSTTERIVVEQARNLSFAFADALRVKDEAKIDELIASNTQTIELARGLDQPFAKAMIDIVDSRRAEQQQQAEQQAEQSQSEKTPQDYLDEYEGADLDTLSYEELTEKGLYNFQNALLVYNLSDKDYDCIEAILVKVLDDEGISELPLAIKESVAEKFDIVDGIPEALLADGFVF